MFEGQIEEQNIDEDLEMRNPRAILMGILGEMYPTGAIDSEPSEILAILNDLDSGKIDSEEAIRQAEEIRRHRQDCH